MRFFNLEREREHMLRRMLYGSLIAAVMLWGNIACAEAELVHDVEWEFWLEKNGEKASEFWFSDEMTVCVQIKNTGDEVIQNPVGVANIEVKDIEAGPTYLFATIQWAMYTLGRVLPIGLAMPQGQMVVEVPESVEPGESCFWSETYIVADLIQEIMERKGNIKWTMDKESGKGSMKFKGFPMKYIMPVTLNFDIDEVEVLLMVRLYIDDEPTESQKYGFKLARP
jgi:hypothetical protein